MKPESKKLIALLTVVLIASGCGGNTNPEQKGPSTSPIQIDTFEVIPSNILSGQKATVRMTLENTGTTAASNVGVQLFGPAWLNSNRINEEQTEMDFGRLQASSETSFPVTRTTGFDAPQIDSGQTSNYNINAEIAYSYSTDATTDFKFVSRERFREQGYTLSAANIENSPGPIQLGIRGRTPIRFQNDPGSNTENGEFCITVQNEGSGTPFNSSVSSALNGQIADANKNVVELQVDSAAGITITPEDGSNVELVGGNRGWNCYTLKAEMGSSSETNVNLDIRAEYNYTKETSTSMSVEGK